MHDSNSRGHRPKRVQEYNEGQAAAHGFTTAMKAILAVPKARIVEREKQPVRKQRK